jgi:hypothetical protein
MSVAPSVGGEGGGAPASLVGAVALWTTGAALFEHDAQVATTTTDARKNTAVRARANVSVPLRTSPAKNLP